MLDLDVKFQESSFHDIVQSNVNDIMDDIIDNKVGKELLRSNQGVEIEPDFSWDEFEKTSRLRSSSATFLWYEHSVRNMFCRVAIEFRTDKQEFIGASVRFSVDKHPDKMNDYNPEKYFAYRIHSNGELEEKY